MFLIILLYALLALTFVIAKYTLNYASPIFLIATRMITAGTVLLFYQYSKSKTRIKLHKKDVKLFLKTALFHIYLAFVLEFWALQFISSSKTNIIYSSTPFISATLAYYILGEKLSRKKIAGLILGFCSLIPIFIIQSNGETISQLFTLSLPEFVLFFAVACSAYAWFLVKKLMEKGYQLLTINGYSMFIGGFLALLTSIIFEILIPYIKSENIILIYNFKLFVGWLALLILSANIGVYNLYGWLLRKYSITFLTFAGFLCPVFGAFFGWILMNETISLNYFVALIGITLSLYIFYQDELLTKKTI